MSKATENRKKAFLEEKKGKVIRPGSSKIFVGVYHHLVKDDTSDAVTLAEEHGEGQQKQQQPQQNTVSPALQSNVQKSWGLGQWDYWH